MHTCCRGRWAGLLAVLALALPIAGCGRAGGATANAVDEGLAAGGQDKAVTRPGASSDAAARIERLRAQARLDEFADAALAAGLESPDDAALHVVRGEALLATGRAEECEASAARAATLAADSGDYVLAGQALKLWAIARMRQGKSLDEPFVEVLLPQVLSREEGVEVVAYWHARLAGRRPFRLASNPSAPVEVETAQSDSGTIPFALAAIQARANGVPMGRVFIDTGAQHTLMTAEAAGAAGVRVGEAGTSLRGFAGLVAQPGVLDTLELGELVLHDVPVLVGDSAPLVANRGQISLGTELMQHVRFHIHYPDRRVAVEGAREAAPRSSEPVWSIPVWTFSQICLAQGRLPDGSLARVLVDTGNGAGTFVSHRWGRRHLPPLRAKDSTMVFHFQKRNLALEALELGGERLVDWPVANTLPGELDRLNQVDVIVGYDLLWPYELSIDLPRRVLELRGRSDETLPKPIGAEARP